MTHSKEHERKHKKEAHRLGIAGVVFAALAVGAMFALSGGIQAIVVLVSVLVSLGCFVGLIAKADGK